MLWFGTVHSTSMELSQLGLQTKSQHLPLRVTHVHQISPALVRPTCLPASRFYSPGESAAANWGACGMERGRKSSKNNVSEDYVTTHEHAQVKTEATTECGIPCMQHWGKVTAQRQKSVVSRG